MLPGSGATGRSCRDWACRLDLEFTFGCFEDQENGAFLKLLYLCNNFWRTLVKHNTKSITALDCHRDQRER